MGKKARERREKWAKINEAREIEGLVKRARLYDKMRALHNQHPLEYWLDTGNPWGANLVLPSGGEAVFVIDEINYTSTAREIIRRFDNSAMDESVFLLNRDIPIKPPFDTMWVEFNWSSIAGLRDIPIQFTASFGAYIQCNGSDEEEEEEEQGDYYTMLIAPMRYWNSTKKIDVIDSPPMMLLDKEGRYLSLDTWWREPNESWLYLALILNALRFINCKNITWIDNEPNGIDSLKFERHYHIPLANYKTLAIKMDERRYAQGEQQQQFDVMPLHLRRGNFAHYSDDAPLFGKYTGTFWRPATVVGNAKNGVVVKDYKVKPPADE